MKKIKIIAVLGIFLLSFLAHQMQELFPNFLTSIFFPINESIWEHMKIISTSILIYGIIDYILLKKAKINFNNFSFQLFFTVCSSIIIYLIIYIPIYYIFGENLLISILLLLIVYIISQIISYILLSKEKYKFLNSIAVPAFILLYITFTYLTYNPPKNFLFFDTIENKYGINNYIIK